MSINSHKRFWSKVRKTATCWLWTASKFKDGYGKFWLQGRNHPAQRVAWLYATDVLPKSFVLHRCDTPACVRFSHLFLGDAGDNARDREAKGRSQPINGALNPARRYPERVRRGAPHPQAKLSTADVVEIRALRKAGLTLAAIGEAYGISATHVCGLAANRFWKGA